jgi:hypothetical protein
MNVRRGSFCLGLLAATALFISIAATQAWAQLPADAVILEKVNISEKQKSHELDPVTLEEADPKLPTWEFKGVKYGSSKADSQEKFKADPDKFAKAAEKQRYINNFIKSMSTVWCPVTDEITPGGMTQWTRNGVVFESCCTFCDENFEEENFVEGLKRLKQRAEKTYGLVGAKYTEGAKSPVEGAMKEVAQ